MEDAALTPSPGALTLSPGPLLNVVTTAVPMTTAPAVIGVVIGLVLLTVVVLGFLLYRYLCHNKGDYRTTGEPAPGEDPHDEHKEQAPNKKEYFI